MLLTTILRTWLTRSREPFTFSSNYSNTLDFAGLDDLGLYVHIPFCRSLCSFCPYCKVIYNAAKASRYKAALLREIDLVCNGMKTRQAVSTLYFGGGTPALMVDDLGEIIAALGQYFEIRDGIGVELHPEDIKPETLRKLREAGVTMLSLGIQSFDRDCLAKLGRQGEDFPEKLRLARAYGFLAIDVDLIFAIPSQTDASLRIDVATAFANGATQVSTYPFIDFTFADNTYKPMAERIKKQMLRRLVVYCQSRGLERTSVWTFAQPGTQKYSSITRDFFLGFGVSATTLLDDSFKINTFSIEEYSKRIDALRLPTALTMQFTPRQRAAYFLFWNAYTLHIDPRRFEAVVGRPLAKLYGAEFALARLLGYLKKDGESYVLTAKAAALYHYVEQAYTSAYIDKMWHVLREEAFPEGMKLE